MKKHYLAWRSFDLGDGVWVAVETVAKKLGVCERTVQYNLRKLQGIGLIQVTERLGWSSAGQLLHVPHPAMVG
jgi:Mn-dependent DtxR family transcriptional regulator